MTGSGEDGVWDVFISYASEDRHIATTLAAKLGAAGVSVWLDRFELKLGDSLREKIDEGLSQCGYGIVILSSDFFSKHYPIRELNGLAQREVDGDKIILPIWSRLTEQDVRRFSPALADKIAVRWEDGPEVVVGKILEVVRPGQGASPRQPDHDSAHDKKARSPAVGSAEFERNQMRSIALVAFIIAMAWGAVIFHDLLVLPRYGTRYLPTKWVMDYFNTVRLVAVLSSIAFAFTARIFYLHRRDLFVKFFDRERLAKMALWGAMTGLGAFGLFFIMLRIEGSL